MISFKGTYKFKLTKILGNISELFTENLTGYGISPKHFGALLAVREYPMITQKELAGYLNIDQSTMGHIIDLLEEKRYLERKKNITDRRAYSLNLTKDGEKIVIKLWETLRYCEDCTMQNLDEKEKETFSRLVDKILGK
jgi:DNA-binding MarR family transcriptional regulator